MAIKPKYDSLLDDVRETDLIPQVDSDPYDPVAEESWVLRTVSGGTGSGEAYGLLLTLTQPGTGGTSSYQFSYQTIEGTTVRTNLA